MNTKDKTLIEEFRDKLDCSFKLVLKRFDDSKTEVLEEFCTKFSSLVPNIEIESQKSDLYPSVSIGNNIEYLAAPSGNELSPFLDEILSMSKSGRIVPENLKEVLSRIEEPFTIDVYVSTFCPTCPYTVRQMIGAAGFNPNIIVRVIDTELFTELTGENKIMSVPTVIVRDMRWSGEVKFSEILEFIVDVEPREMSAHSLSRMLKDGEASKISAYMLESGVIFPSFMELLLNEKWSVRLGAIVVMEEISEISRELCETIVPFILKNYGNMTHQVKGDLLYVTGLSGARDIIPDLQRIFDETENEELKTAALEAIEEIENYYSLN